MPEGAAVRKAIQWISQMRQEEASTSLASLIEKASIRFNLPPKDCEFLNRFFSEQSARTEKKG